MPRVPFYLVDSFTKTPFQGNPAGIVILERPGDADWMQAVAMEMNQAETAFLHPVEGGFGLRWFTPTVEVDLCGHATLASAHVLWESGRLPRDQAACFHTRSGWLSCTAASGGMIDMDFPAMPVTAADAPPGLGEALEVDQGEVFRNAMDYLVVLEEDVQVTALEPDFVALARIKCRGVIVTAAAQRSGGSHDYVCRFFAPQNGIPEDPVTGSAHCALGPYWAKQLGKNPVRGFQASPRGGYVTVIDRGDRVTLQGAAVTVVTGELKTN